MKIESVIRRLRDCKGKFRLVGEQIRTKDKTFKIKTLYWKEPCIYGTICPLNYLTRQRSDKMPIDSDIYTFKEVLKLNPFDLHVLIKVFDNSENKLSTEKRKKIRRSILKALGLKETE